MKYERPREAQVEARLAAALLATARGAGIDVAVTAHRSRPWASATFVGAHHVLTLLAPRSSGLGEWIAALPDAEMPMRGHLVASVAIDRIEDDGAAVTLVLDVLTLEES